uniref:PX domain-containing protein n=2 Tax=Denticeps clupeoides TaxID=299321 RepID=A0AAY4BEG3_9TELE
VGMSQQKCEFISVWVQDPHVHRDDFWHTHVDYQICLHTNSMCFWRKRSCVRRRYSEFVWLRHKLQENALLMDLPKLPPGTPFFSSRNSSHVAERMKGLQQFLEAVLQRTLFLSDSRLHLFLQSELSVGRMEACSQGLTRYTIAQAILSSAHNVSHPPYGPETRDDDDDNSSSNSDCDSDCERCVGGGGRRQ